MGQATLTASSKFCDLYEEEYDAVYAFCARRVGAADAADAAADVFSVAWRRIDDVPDDAGRRWLFGVARNTVLNRWRSKRRQARLLDRVRAVRRPVSVGPEVEVDRNDEARAVLAALRSLRAADQEMLVMSAWDELASKEIAEIVGISVAAVDQRVHRAKRRLAAALEAAPDVRAGLDGARGGDDR